MSDEVSNAAKTLNNAKKEKKLKIKDVPHTAAPNAVNLAAEVRPAGKNIDTEPIRGNVVDEQFPTEALTQADEQDEIMTMKLALQEKDKPGVTKFGLLTAKEDDFKWLAKKKELETEAEFQTWFAEGYDRASPEQKKIARELYPSFYQQRLHKLHKDVELQKRIAEIQLNGIQSKEDLILQFAIEMGFIDGDPLENILHPERAAAAKDKATQQKNFRRGLLNPRRLPRGDWGPRTRMQNAQGLTGKKADALFPGTPAYKLGTSRGDVNYGFSAYGKDKFLTETEESTSQWSKLAEVLDL
jgi:hypothetical protein